MSYFLAIPGQLCNISGPLRDDDFTIDLTQGEIFSVFFMTYFVIIPTKTYTSIVSTYLYPCIMKLRRKSYNLSQSSLFLDVKRTFRHTFLYSELRCLPCGDPRTLWANARIRLLATHSFIFNEVSFLTYMKQNALDHDITWFLQYFLPTQVNTLLK